MDQLSEDQRKENYKKMNNYHLIFNKWRDFDFLTTCFSIVGLVLAIVNFEFDVSKNLMPIDTKQYPDPVQNPRNTSSMSCICRMISCFATLLSLFCLYLRNWYKLKWYNLYLSNDKNSKNKINIMFDDVVNEEKCEFGHHNHFINLNFIIEVLILVCCPIPYYEKYITMKYGNDQEITFLLSDFLLAFMFLRLYFFVRTSYNYSIYTDALSKKVCHQYGFKADLWFAIQSKLLIDPMETVIIMVCGTVFLFAYLIRIFELPNDPTNFVSYFNAIWLTVITLTTVGYGDISPETQPGKIVVIILAAWGAIFLALLVPTMSNIFNLDQNQELALRHIRLTRHAAKAICTGIQHFRAKKDVHMLLHLKSHEHDHHHGGGGHNSTFLQLMQEHAQGTTSSEATRARKRPPSPGEEEQDETCSHDSHSHEDYFQRQQNAMAHVHITEETLFKARKKEYLKNRLMHDRLQSFNIERRQFKDMCTSYGRKSLNNQNLMKSEIFEIADRLELVERLIAKQQEMFVQQQVLLTSFSNKLDLTLQQPQFVTQKSRFGDSAGQEELPIQVQQSLIQQHRAGEDQRRNQELVQPDSPQNFEINVPRQSQQRNIQQNARLRKASPPQRNINNSEIDIEYLDQLAQISDEFDNQPSVVEQPQVTPFIAGLTQNKSSKKINNRFNNLSSIDLLGKSKPQLDMTIIQQSNQSSIQMKASYSKKRGQSQISESQRDLTLNNESPTTMIRNQNIQTVQDQLQQKKLNNIKKHQVFSLTTQNSPSQQKIQRRLEIESMQQQNPCMGTKPTLRLQAQPSLIQSYKDYMDDRLHEQTDDDIMMPTPTKLSKGRSMDVQNLKKQKSANFKLRPRRSFFGLATQLPQQQDTLDDIQYRQAMEEIDQQLQDDQVQHASNMKQQSQQNLRRQRNFSVTQHKLSSQINPASFDKKSIGDQWPKQAPPQTSGGKDARLKNQVMNETDSSLENPEFRKRHVRNKTKLMEGGGREEQHQQLPSQLTRVINNLQERTTQMFMANNNAQCSMSKSQTLWEPLLADENPKCGTKDD